ncbi:MAG: hypothetical protein Q8R37_04010 [Nanoarchaeota archaeon]|nr:hypothetical protein [Nanoarchaeota archaeon]
MSILTTIQEGLESNPQVVVLRSDQRIPYKTYRYDDVLHKVVYCLAPKEGLYCKDTLQQFLEGLFPDLTPIFTLKFHAAEDWMQCGSLLYSEVIAREESVFTLHDQDAFNSSIQREFFDSWHSSSASSSSRDNRHQITTIVDYYRHILLKLFPDSALGLSYLSENQPIYDRVTLLQMKDVRKSAEANLKSAALSVVDNGEQGNLSLPENGLVSLVKKFFR